MAVCEANCNVSSQQQKGNVIHLMKRLFLGIPAKHSLDALYPPTGILYLAAAARNCGHSVKVVDGQAVVGDEVLLKRVCFARF